MTEAALPPAPRSLARNWPMRFGGLLALLGLLLALFGPLLAPQDPLQENYVAKVEGRFIRPPFPPGTEGYPLGADDFGRDVLSRLLWSVRPTMILVLVVAALRMAAGLLVGLLAGWQTGRLARWLDSLISAALSVPVLFVALFVIAALARRWGVWAFILGLSIIGWAESARLVQEQTRAIKGQPFIEAARAMGGSHGQITLSHVVPHVLPLMWIQLSFEVSGALMTTAALGFLGYFVNAVWIPIEDWVGLRVSGTPELSQMLGVSIQKQPWTAVFAGTLVFLIVLAFNLLGEGLRIHFSPERRRSSEPAQGAGRVSSWLEERLYLAVSEWRRTAAVGGAFGLLAVLVLGGGWLLWRAQSSGISLSVIQVPGEHPWASELRDAQATLWTLTGGPAHPQLLWSYQADGRFVGGPVVDQQGRLYLNTSGAKMVSLSADGQLRGSFKLPASAVGWPALSPDGSIIVAETQGGLSAFSPDGDLLWSYTSDPPDKGRSGPVIGVDGTIYYSVQNFLVAVDAQGHRSWQIRLPTYSFTSALPRLSGDGKLLFFEDTVVDALTGQRLFGETGAPMDRYVVGADGRIYLNTAESFLEWRETENGAVMSPHIQLDSRTLLSSYRAPLLVGIAPSRQAWLLYDSSYEYMRLVWVAQKGQTFQITDLPYRQGKLIGIDAVGTAYLCGVSRGSTECRAVRLDNGMVLWKTDLPSKSAPVGGALLEGRMYMATEDGHLFALGR